MERVESADRHATTRESEHLAHVTSRRGVTAAVVEGTPVVTLCGRLLVPSRDPRGRTRCPRCLELVERAGLVVPEP